jgi:hypothetical protein
MQQATATKMEKKNTIMKKHHIWALVGGSRL